MTGAIHKPINSDLQVISRLECKSIEMPELIQPSSSQLCKARVFVIAIYLVVFTPILWLLYSKSTPKMSSQASSREPVLLKNASSGNFEPSDKPPGPGPGEGGTPHKLRSDQIHAARLSQFKYGMNMICSDEISLDRSIPDLRHRECEHWQYPQTLPDASVVIVFYNEGFSTLMRTVHSVINRTPPQFLAEVLLVDDCSDEDDLEAKLESHIQRWNGTVRLIRNQERDGIINTTSRGAREARGKVVVFLDAHCEVNENWLPPLLAPIYENQMTMTVPIIDGIDSTNFEVRAVYPEGRHFKGIFDWGLHYKEKELSRKEISRTFTRPYKSPTAGGLFAIDREYFLELGAYDPGLHAWGGENLELSFKIWMCGGRIMWVPCSRVAHVNKSTMPHKFAKRPPIKLIDYKRVVETWMDDKFKEYFYTREPLARFLDMGDISERLKLKQNLDDDYECHSFQWFMDKVAHDVWFDFPDPSPNLHWGRMKNEATHNCLDTLGRDAPTRISALNCSQGFTSDQLVRLNAQGQLGIDERCVEADSNGVTLKTCEIGSDTGPWQYKEQLKVMLHMLEMKCLAVNPESLQLDLLRCDPVSNYTQWKFVAITISN